MTPAETQAAAAKLHTDFCKLTGRTVPLRFHEREWFDLLRSPEYHGDAEQLGADVAHLVRYLQRGIAQEKRNAGSLKLMNFLQPDKFFEDLAEAKVLMKPRKHAISPGVPVRPDHAPLPIDQEEALRKQAAAQLGQFRQFLRGGGE